ncbi:Gep7p Ecym_3078 [Eremothecium cymbalariae DBVPG|uniref:Genetic interactor of prohibitin 7, mitochondrial n=1 Tax=Eremothecium cymbalariae (strain CBS 270.75 / DBVPG 7215 / KCTC 17166 / NRRL Y-17582) TaxID=931890 RepID=G8JR21_ERECY|nr:Hypothetical protein Ecym_3078 [Eremothecium cymbalariae DBVPG\
MNKVPIKTAKAVPKSLLYRQAKRTGSPTISDGQRANLIIESLRDVGSLFYTSYNDDDEKDAILRHESIVAKLNSGELDVLIRHNYSSMHSAHCCDANLLRAKYPGTPNECELLQGALDEYNSQDWNKIPHMWKQLAYYHGYGSWGPRKGMSFLGRKPEDFFVTTNRELWRCNEVRKDYLKKAAELDPASRFIMLAAAIVAAIALAGDYRRRQDKNATVIEAHFS